MKVYPMLNPTQTRTRYVPATEVIALIAKGWIMEDPDVTAARKRG